MQQKIMFSRSNDCTNMIMATCRGTKYLMMALVIMGHKNHITSGNKSVSDSEKCGNNDEGG